MFRKILLVIRFVQLAFSYFFSTKKYGGNSKGLDVSLTTFGYRIYVVGIAIGSFVSHSKHIRNVYLTIDCEEELNALKKISIFLLKRKGVNVSVQPRRGPHSKYWYFISNFWDKKSPFLLIDDDVIYESDVANRLYQESLNTKSNLCVRAFRFGYSDNRIQPYVCWEPIFKVQANLTVFATNVGGVLITKKFGIKLLELGEQYMINCKSADDIWFHWVSVRYEMPYKQIADYFVNPQAIPLTQKGGLSNTINIHGNDESIKAQYTSKDLTKIFKSTTKND